MKPENVFRILAACMAAGLICGGCSREIKDKISSPIDFSTVPPTPFGLSARIGDGFVALNWIISDTSLVSSYNIYRADSTGADYIYIGNSFTESYIADNLQNGVLYYFGVRSLNADGFEGYMCEPASAVPDFYSILINNGDEFTGSRNVSLGLSAPVGTALMQLSSDSSFTAVEWETFSPARNFLLEYGDGAKTVYARFRNPADQITSGYYSDSIILDTESFIDSVLFSPAGPFSPGETVHFALFANETEGQARITLGSSIATVDLRDDGTRGDGSPDDGIYEFDYDIPPSFDFENQMVYGDFIDRAGNPADRIQCANRISVRRIPDPVTIFSVIAPQGFHDRLSLNWQVSAAQDFAQYRVYRDMSAGVDSTDYLAAAISSIGQTSLSDTGLLENTEYYYKVYVVDMTGLWGGSNEAAATTGEDLTPEPVDLYPILSQPDFYQDVDIEWSPSSANDFGSYRLYRWQENIGRGDSLLVAFIVEPANVALTDHPPFNTSADTINFWYILHLYDDGGNTAPSDSVRAHLVDEIPDQVSGAVTASDSSLYITWSQTDIPDFGSYRLLRDVDSNPAGAITVFVASDPTTTNYNDDSTAEGQTYYYWLDLYDLRGNTSRSVLGSGAW
jgi:fibronectin type 3 domain-containing protein